LERFSQNAFSPQFYSQLRSLTDAERIFEKLAKISLKQSIPQDVKSSDMAIL